MRANKKIKVRKDISGLSEIVFALRMKQSVRNKSPYGWSTIQELNSIKRIQTNKHKSISATPEFKLTDDFESMKNLTILVREERRDRNWIDTSEKEGSVAGAKQPCDYFIARRKDEIDEYLQKRSWTVGTAVMRFKRGEHVTKTNGRTKRERVNKGERDDK